MLPDTVSFRANAWIKISVATLHTSKLLRCVYLLPLKIKQNQNVTIYNRKFHHKTFLLSVEKQILYNPCPNRAFCGFNHSSRLALRLNTINLRHYFQISQSFTKIKIVQISRVFSVVQQCDRNCVVYLSLPPQFYQ